jgi:hypothetical protein
LNRRRYLRSYLKTLIPKDKTEQVEELCNKHILNRKQILEYARMVIGLVERRIIDRSEFLEILKKWRRPHLDQNYVTVYSRILLNKSSP